MRSGQASPFYLVNIINIEQVFSDVNLDIFTLVIISTEAYHTIKHHINARGFFLKP